VMAKCTTWHPFIHKWPLILFRIRRHRFWEGRERESDGLAPPPYQIKKKGSEFRFTKPRDLCPFLSICGAGTEMRVLRDVPFVLDEKSSVNLRVSTNCAMAARTRNGRTTAHCRAPPSTAAHRLTSAAMA
jgi:hypothetical protein